MLKTASYDTTRTCRRNGKSFRCNKTTYTPITNEGEYIIDFTVYDAIKAGFDNIIFVIRKDIEDIFEDRIGAGLRKNEVKFTYVYQDRELPAGYEFLKIVFNLLGRYKPYYAPEK